jgi:hypothetical protein
MSRDRVAMARPFDHGNELSGPLQGVEFLDELSKYELPKEESDSHS